MIKNVFSGTYFELTEQNTDHLDVDACLIKMDHEEKYGIETEEYNSCLEFAQMILRLFGGERAFEILFT